MISFFPLALKSCCWPVENDFDSPLYKTWWMKLSFTLLCIVKLTWLLLRDAFGLPPCCFSPLRPWSWSTTVGASSRRQFTASGLESLAYCSYLTIGSSQKMFCLHFATRSTTNGSSDIVIWEPASFNLFFLQHHQKKRTIAYEMADIF